MKTFAVILFSLLCCTDYSVRAYLVLYPALVGNNELFIRNSESLVRFPGALDAFLCEDCPDDTLIMTRDDYVQILSHWIDNRGHQIRFREGGTLRILDGIFLHENETVQPRIPYISLMVGLTEDVYQRTVIVETQNWHRRLRLRHDVIPPTAAIELLEANGTDYRLRVHFSEPVVWNPPPPSCPVIPPLNDQEGSADLMRNLSRRCSNNLLENGLIDGIVVTGATAFISQSANNKVNLSLRVENRERTANVIVQVREKFTDFAGNRLAIPNDRILYYRPYPPPKERQSRLLERMINFPVKSRINAKFVGQAATAVVAGAVGASMATSAMSGGGGSGASVGLLNGVQKIHMTGMLAVTRMPQTYENFTGEVKWAVLDIKSPWERNNTRKRNATRTEGPRGAGRSLKVVEAFLEAEEEEDEFDYFGRIMFWVPALILVVTAVHLFILSILIINEKPIPDILQFPRIELMLGFFVLPPISIAAAGLYKGTLERALLGTWIIIAVPVQFIVWNIFMLWFYVLRLPPHLREVNLLMDIPNKKQRALRQIHAALFETKKQKVHEGTTNSLGSNPTSTATHASNGVIVEVDPVPHHPPMNRTIQRLDTMHREAVVEEAHLGILGEDSNEQEAATCSEIFSSISNMTVLTFLFGNHQDEADWCGTKTQGSKFMARWGVLFEDHRGPPIGRRDVTLDVDPVTGRVDRGELVILRERPLVTVHYCTFREGQFSFQRFKIYRYHVQVMTKLLDISKTILVGCIIAGVGNTDDNAMSIVVLIALSLILILLLRIAKPFPSRIDMLMLLLAEVADLIVYTCALFLIVGPDTNEDTDDNIGLALLLSEAFALLAVAIEYAVLSVGFGLEAHQEYTEAKKHKFFDVAHQALMQNERYLTKKYFDRWMVRVLSKGLNGRIPQRHELQWKKAIKINVLYVWSLFQWFCEECRNICNDGRKCCGWK